jgi:hypothetical protein
MKFIDLWLAPLAWFHLAEYETTYNTKGEPQPKTSVSPGDQRAYALVSLGLVVTSILLVLLIVGAMV